MLRRGSEPNGLAKHLLVVGSGETERRALPHLLRHVVGFEVTSLTVRVPASGQLTTAQALKVIKGAWWESQGRGEPLDKVVVLIDADAARPEDAEAAFADLHRLTADLPIAVFVCSAKWHLEAWFFGDREGLRSWLGGKSLRRVAADPDEIIHPKLRLRALLSGPYTARTAESIAAAISAEVIAQRSKSFARFERAVRNGKGNDTIAVRDGR